MAGLPFCSLLSLYNAVSGWSKVDVLGSALHLCTDGQAANGHVPPHVAAFLGGFGVCMGFALPKGTVMDTSGHLLRVGGGLPSLPLISS